MRAQAVLLEALAAHCSAGHAGVRLSRELREGVSSHLRGYPLRFAVCTGVLSDRAVLRVRTAYLKALDCFLVLLSVETTAAERLV